MFKKFKKVYVLDTNIILENADEVINLSQNSENLIVIPETVIDEIDGKKQGHSEINFQAREFGRFIADAELLGKDQFSSYDVVKLKINDVRIDIISCQKYNLENSESVIADRKILQITTFAKNHYSEDVEFISNDVMCRLRAMSLNIKTSGIIRNKHNLETEYIKTITGLKDNFKAMAFQSIRKYDKDYKKENFCYHFKSTSGNEKIAYISNEQINFITPEMFTGLPIKPMNVGQKFALAGMLDNNFAINVIEAKAGSGKTLLAIAAGIRLINMKKYDKIIYIRNSVESTDKAEEVGFLPGMEDKFKIYNYPLYDTLYFIAKQMNEGISDEKIIVSKIRELETKSKIETIWPGAIRGRTLSNAFVIVDEVQNFSKKSLQTVLSRLDEKCKCICIGSNRQIDHPYINKYTNGLSTLIAATKDEHLEVNMFGTVLDKVVRGKITEFTERIFS